MTKTRALIAAIVLLCGACILAIVLAVSAATHANEVALIVQRSSESQIANRAGNVSVWCGAINDQRTYARGRAVLLHQPRYALPNLDCPALEMATTKSAKP